MSQREQLRAALAHIEAGIVRAETPDLHVGRARILITLGEPEGAKQAFLDALALDPTHFAALNDFGALLRELNFRTAARTLFNESVRRHPREATARVNLATLLMYEGEPGAARDQLLAALAVDPDNCAAHQRLSELAREAGDLEAMRAHRARGYGPRPVERLPFLGDGEPFPVLVLVSTPAADFAWPKLIDGARFQATTLVAEFVDPAAPLPQHGLILNAIGDADIALADLEAADAIVARSPARVINHPNLVLATGRAANAERLNVLDGVIVPRIAVLPRKVLTGAGATSRLSELGFGFPLLIRSPGFHNGRFFMHVETPAELTEAASALPGPELLAMEFLDARGPDGLVRKYRVMLIGGALYPLHLAISPDWKVHYATAPMGERAAFRDEEARFLADMPAAIGPRATAALHAISITLGLDYAGIDFGLNADGDVLLFEANAVMNIFEPEDAECRAYRKAAVAAAIAAARGLVSAETRASETVLPARPN